jgi:hypothetical protein
MSSYKIQVAAKKANRIKPLDYVYEWSLFAQTNKKEIKRERKKHYG